MIKGDDAMEAMQCNATQWKQCSHAAAGRRLVRTTFTACDGAGEVAPDDSNCFMDSSGHLAAQDHFLSQMDEQSEETVVRQDVGEFAFRVWNL